MIKLTKTFLPLVICLSFIINVNAASVLNVNTEDQNTYTDNNTPIKINDAAVGIFPGGVAQKTFVPKSRFSLDVQKDFIVTGIDADDAEHGKEIVIYATVGKITLVPNNTDSQVGNRIAASNNTVVNQGQFAELIYDGNIGKWIITNIE